MTFPDLIHDETQYIPAEAPGATVLSLAQCLERGLLAAPGSQQALRLEPDGLTLGDGVCSYPIRDGCPVLYPRAISAAWQDGALPLAYPSSALLQYALLSQIKQAGEINAPLDSAPARKHQHRFRELCKSLQGLVLDVGSDRPSHSSRLLPRGCEYVGLDPYAGQGEFRLIGLGELLPLRSGSVDAVVFNTSLDHMLDHHTALLEAHRALRDGGRVVIATYAWLERATLLSDAVHFHHFREFEVLGALDDGFAVEGVLRYQDVKHDSHRYGLYVMARKRPWRAGRRG